ncbi:magnesium transporter [Lachnospiraceae bacterium C7]|nr:magnesium transporter [Lachnospiraceae bacterium C7]
MNNTTLLKEQTESYVNEILSIVQNSLSPTIMLQQLNQYHENDIADALLEMNSNERRRIYRILDFDTLADIFGYLDESIVCQYLSELDLNGQMQILSAMSTDEAADILHQLPQSQKDLLISLLDKETQKELLMMAGFDEEQIGSRLSTDYIVIPNNLSVAEATKELIRQAADNDNISHIYVTNPDGIYDGAIELKDLIIARREDSLKNIIVTSYPYVYARETIDSCLEWIKDYSESSIPALDDTNHIIGVITASELIEVVDDEMGEDYVKLGGLTAEEDLAEPITMSIKKRLPWLVILLILGMLVSSVVGLFEQIVAELTILMLFQSMILDMAGNVGTQSLAVTIRVLMDENLTIKEKFGLIVKEGRIGFLNGLLLGLSAFLVSGLYIHFFKGQPFGFAFTVSACIGFALMVAMFVSSIIGTITPMAFKKIGIDPAVASGPLITTINDLVSVVTYYGLAWIVLIRGAGL